MQAGPTGRSDLDGGRGFGHSLAPGSPSPAVEMVMRKNLLVGGLLVLVASGCYATNNTERLSLALAFAREAAFG